uniref:Beta-hexosaminidase eukaryotic type N-terminal domain-containing protein n=1 Tax=Oryza nivara TaxID=4536 RepID=A0A0E0HHY7_ORYNI
MGGGERAEGKRNGRQGSMVAGKRRGAVTAEVAEKGAWRRWASSAALLCQPCRRRRRERRAERTERTSTSFSPLVPLTKYTLSRVPVLILALSVSDPNVPLGPVVDESYTLSVLLDSGSADISATTPWGMGRHPICPPPAHRHFVRRPRSLVAVVRRSAAARTRCLSRPPPAHRAHSVKKKGKRRGGEENKEKRRGRCVTDMWAPTDLNKSRC